MQVNGGIDSPVVQVSGGIDSPVVQVSGGIDSPVVQVSGGKCLYSPASERHYRDTIEIL